MSIVQHQQLYKFIKKASLVESSRALEAREAALAVNTDKSSKESLFPDEKPNANNRKNPALDRKGNRTRQSCTDT